MPDILTFKPPTSLKHATSQRKTLLRNTLAMSQIPPDVATMAACIQLGMEIAQLNGLKPLDVIELMGQSIGVKLMVDDGFTDDGLEREQKIGGEVQ